MAPKWKVAENFLRIDRHRPKIGLNLNFLGYSNSSWTGPNMRTWFYGKSKLWWKVPALPNPAMKEPTTRKNWENRFPCFDAISNKPLDFPKKFNLRPHFYTLPSCVPFNERGRRLVSWLMCFRAKWTLRVYQGSRTKTKTSSRYSTLVFHKNLLSKE